MEKNNKYPWKQKWASRNKLVGALVGNVPRVLDIGGGLGGLRNNLNPDTYYVSVDLKKWTNRTIVADLNLSYPALGLFNCVVCQGVLEYIKDPTMFLRAMKMYSGRMILTYRESAGGKTPMPRYDYKHSEVEKYLTYAGWHIHSIQDSVSKFEKIYVCLL